MNSKIITPSEFSDFTQSLIGMRVSHIWTGYGSAVFLEFGDLHPGRIRRNGSVGNRNGDWTLIIEWGWRIEGKRRIWCGSWSEETRWPRAFQRLLNTRVESVSLFGRLPEIDVALNNGLHVVSFMTAESDPEWGLIRHFDEKIESIGILAGRLRWVDESSREIDT